jgi:hypothetical protein
VTGNLCRYYLRGHEKSEATSELIRTRLESRILGKMCRLALPDWCVENPSSTTEFPNPVESRTVLFHVDSDYRVISENHEIEGPRLNREPLLSVDASKNRTPHIKIDNNNNNLLSFSQQTIKRTASHLQQLRMSSDESTDNPPPAAAVRPPPGCLEEGQW